MTKCRKHPYEQGVGVCASCLRERLLALIAAESDLPQYCCVGTSSPGESPADGHPPALQQKKQQQPRAPPLLFPRSVSPYVSRRRSLDLDALSGADDGDHCRRRQPLRFFSTPQVGPATGGRKGPGVRFSILSSLFGGGKKFRSENPEQDCRASSTAPRPSSWFAGLIPGWRKKEHSRHSALDTAEEDSARRRRKAWCRDRGMSPVRDEDSSGSEGGYSTESPEWKRRPMPMPTPIRKHAPEPSAHRAISGFVVCLSPLVRASPRRSHVGDGAPSGETRGAAGLSRRCHHHRHRRGGDGRATLWQNRSRKLADLGRFR